ncbi:hypothetical protein SAMN04487959_11037 [Modicisalibacter xianhensis]|uniref:Uncharacterized protein n=1 Tax=Modicisalibacter xianhensis TaxID=442341 RepID=A0A1I3D641_9GAMM|nr:hypothetical protein SAMN04487959_11037 [Halomonas xianhensis]
MKNVSDLPRTGIPSTLHLVVARRPEHGPVVFGKLTYLHVPSQANPSAPLQAARGDDDLMSMEPSSA